MFESKSLVLDLSSGLLALYGQVPPSADRSQWLSAARAGAYVVVESGPDHGDVVRVTTGELEPTEVRYVVARHRLGLIHEGGPLRVSGLNDPEPAQLELPPGRYELEVVELDPNAALDAAGIRDPDTTRGHQDFCPDYVLRLRLLGPEEPLPVVAELPHWSISPATLLGPGGLPMPSPPPR